MASASSVDLSQEFGIVIPAVPGLRLLEYLECLKSVVSPVSITDAGPMGKRAWAFF
jgi:hypothetical protein